MSAGGIDLTPQVVQAVRDSVDIVSIASEHTRLKQQGRRHGGLCPLHKEKTPSFSVDPDQGLFYCFGCGAGGDAIRLHMLLSGDDFPAAIESLALRYGIAISRGRSSSRRDDGPDLRPALEAAEEYFRQQLKNSPKARHYLEQRRMPPELVDQYALGYAPDSWDALREALTSHLSVDQLLAAGLVGRSQRSGKLYDRFRDRLIFPIRGGTGRLLGFGGRTLGDDKAKYVNTAETDAFQKSLILYGLHESKRSIRDSGRVILTEGYFDVLGTVAAGLPLAVASMGTSLTQEQAKLLARFAEEVIVAYDGDAAGETAFHRALPLLLEAGLVVRRARLPAGSDPDSVRMEDGSEALQSLVQEARDGVDLEIERLFPFSVARDPRRLAEAGDHLGPLLGAIPDPMLRRAYARQAAERLGQDEAVVLEILQRYEATRHRNQQRQQQRQDARVGGSPRGGGGPPPPEAPGRSAASSGQSSPARRGRPRETRSLEERVLARLLVPPPSGGTHPSADELPNPEVFFDGRCRRLYESYLELYEHSRSPPDAASLQHRLEAAGGSLETLARIEGSRLQDAPAGEGDPWAPGAGSLLEDLATLERRSLTQRLRELAGQMRLAERDQRQEELLQIVEQREALKRRLHRLDGDQRRR